MEYPQTGHNLAPVRCSGPRSLQLQAMLVLFRSQVLNENVKIRGNTNSAEMVLSFAKSVYKRLPYELEVRNADDYRLICSPGFGKRFDMGYIKEIFFENTFMCDDIELDTIHFQSNLVEMCGLYPCNILRELIEFDLDVEGDMTEYWCYTDCGEFQTGLKECCLRALDCLISIHNQVVTVQYLSSIAFDDQLLYLNLLGWAEDYRIKSSYWKTDRAVYGYFISSHANRENLDGAIELVNNVAQNCALDTRRLCKKYMWDQSDVQRELKLSLGHWDPTTQ
jgi:hypothetical protein